ncbi:hypothetical protein [Bradyrhizobium elkanii]|uniref:hypothetical protein n=1 Tax=Bradyrhizobium elkanii TaxID=29448 RepID=UPI000841FEAF|nr:hypothetical protein [Bradyrhizobium elkanii]ODM70501.1 hypothetical protein A6X20_07810 [Bradyrhizobium elkanii]ODM79936.1 hypothetical protein A6452_24270 [Bradyrhizobium elkanii]
MRLSPKLRARFFYSIPDAGLKVGWTRSEAYRAADEGDLPNERHGKHRLVRKSVWDPMVKRLLKEGPSPTKHRRPRKPAPAEANA